MTDHRYDSINRVLDEAMADEDIARLESQLENDLSEWSQDETFTELFTRCLDMAQQNLDEMDDDEALLYATLDFVCATLLVKTAQRRKEGAELNKWLEIKDKTE